MDFLKFFIELSGYIYIAFSLFWAIVAVMFHQRLHIPLPAALALGLVLQVVGFAIMLLIGLVFRAKQADSTSAPNFQSDPFGGNAGFGTSDPFGTGDVYAIPASSKVELGFTKVLVFGMAALGAVLLVLAAFLPWFYSLGTDVELEIGLISSGIEIWLLLTILSVVAGVLLSFRSWSLLSPLLIGYFASWWVALSVASLTNRLAFVNGMSAIYQLPNVISYQGGGSSFVVSQRVGEAWLALLPAGMLLLAAAFIFAYKFASDSVARKTNFF